VQHPRQGDLRGGDALVLGEGGEQVEQRLVGSDVFLVKAGDDLPDVVAGVGLLSGDLPDRNPLASGLNATKPMPSSSQAGITPRSNTRSMIEYSLWIAVSGVTAWARRT
jgi:hypothetical protein